MSIESIITGAIIIGIGILGINILGVEGSRIATIGIEKLDKLNLFGESNSEVSEYDGNGYYKSLNVDEANISLDEEFTYV